MNHTYELLLKRYPTVNPKEIRVVKSPLRICPIGAHIDHQDGTVLGMALDITIDLIYAPNDDGYIRVQSLDFPDEDYFHINEVPARVSNFWGNYLRGAVLALKRNFVLKRGIYGVIRSKQLLGGLSSSASVTTAYLMALCDVNNISLSELDLILYNQWVETHFIGLKNGILDQSINILSRKGYLTLMDTHTLNYELIETPPQMEPYEIVIVYSGIQAALINTSYNNNVDICKVAAWLLREVAHLSLDSFERTKLQSIDYHTYETYQDELPGIFKKRATHYFTEMARVKNGLAAYKEGNLKKFGALMFESGQSSIDNYGCGCPELITIYNTLKNTPGVYGARFSGAGYRGCCIGIIDPDYKEMIKANIDAVYPVKYPNYKDTYKVVFTSIGTGAHIVKEGEAI